MGAVRKWQSAATTQAQATGRPPPQRPSMCPMDKASWIAQYPRNKAGFSR